MKIYILLCFTLFCVNICGQNKRSDSPYQILCDRREYSVCDTIKTFSVNDFKGSFILRIFLLKTGKIVGFDIPKLLLRDEDGNIQYLYRWSAPHAFDLTRYDEYPDSVKMFYPAIQDLVFNRLYVQMRDTSLIEIDTLHVIWGRRFGE